MKTGRVLALIALAACLGLAVAALRRTSTHRPNVLVIVWDTVRADRLSLYGNTSTTTPFLEELARSAVVYDNAISPSHWTLPSHASLFTGLPESVHGATSLHTWLDSRFVTMAEHFGSQGYQNWAFAANANLYPCTNVMQGFPEVEYPSRLPLRKEVEKVTLGLLHPDDRSTRTPNGRLSHEHLKAGPLVTDTLMGWLDGSWDRTRPFFAFVNLMDAHNDRLPSEASRRAIALWEGRYKRMLLTSQRVSRLSGVMLGNMPPYNRNQRLALYDQYDAAILDLDGYLRETVAGLEQRRLLDDTIVVLTSDHGEQFGEHGLYMHNYSVYQALVHVPLVIRYPRELDARRISTPVSTAALFHTLVEMTGIAAPPAPILERDLRTPLDAPVVAELVAPLAHPKKQAPSDRRDFAATYQAIVSGHWKLILASHGGVELFDLVADGKELVNLAGDVAFASVREELTESLRRWNELRPTVAETEGDRALTAEERSSRAGEQAELARELVELGYFAPDEDEEAPTAVPDDEPLSAP